MDAELLVKSLSTREKECVYKILDKEFSSGSLTRIDMFVKLHWNDMSTRLRNALTMAFLCWETTKCIEEIKINDFMHIRNVGKKTVDEFIEVRNRYLMQKQEI